MSKFDKEVLNNLIQTLEQKTKKFNKKTELLRKRIEEIKASCPHKRFVYKYGSNTGNYCPQDDVYWIDIECLDCGKRHTVYDRDEEFGIWNEKIYSKDTELAITEDEYMVLKKTKSEI